MPYASARDLGPMEWRLLLVRGAHEPELLYQTGRFVMGTQFSKSGRHVFMQFETFTLPSESEEELQRLSEPERLDLFFNHAFLRGIIEFDVAASPVSARERIFVGGFPYFGLSPDETLIAVQQQSRRGFEVLVGRGNGPAVRVDGLDGRGVTHGWIPDGSGLVVRAPVNSTEPTLLYLVPLSGGPVEQIEVGRPFVRRPGIAWSPDGQVLALVSEGELFLYDRKMATSRMIAANPMWQRRQPVWTPRGDAIIVDGSVVDVATGRTLASAETKFEILATELSPDQQRLAVLELPEPAFRSSCLPATDTRGRLTDDNRILILDRQTGETRVVLDCGRGVTGRIRWMPDGRHLLIWQEPGQIPVDSARGYAITLLEIATGATTPLTDGREVHADAIVAPDGSRILVHGERLRKYTADGTLLREIVPPAGFDVPNAAWTPDGVSYVYVLGPLGFEPVYP